MKINKDMKLLRKKTIIITACVACVLSAGMYLYACIFEPEWSEYGSVFSPEVTVNNANYQPLFFDTENAFYNGQYINASSRDYSRNDVADWNAYLGTQLPTNTIYGLMYGESPSLQTLKANKNERVQNFFAFLQIARNNEPITATHFNPWNYDESKQAERIAQTEISKADKLYAQALKQKDAFFANRMWFQSVRLRFYSANRSSVIDYFAKTQDAQPKNRLYYRALYYVAGAYKAQKQYANANATLAKVWVGMPDKAQMLTYDYHPLTNAQMNSILPSLSAQEQCALWAMQGYYDKDEAEAIQRILAINPASEEVDFLLSRYVNGIEYKVNVWNEDNPLKQTATYHQHNKKEMSAFNIDWLVSAAEHTAVKNKYLWNVAAGYLLMYKGENARAKAFLQKAEKEAKTPEQQAQIRIIDVLNEVTSCKTIDKEVEKRLLKRVQWLWHYFEDTNDSEKGKLRSGNAFALVRQYLAALYREKGNTLMSELLNFQPNYYKNEQQSVAMEQFLLKTDKSEWEQHWANYYAFNLGDIYESRAIYAFYRDAIDEAIAQMKQTPYVNERVYDEETGRMVTKRLKKSDALLPANPFNGFITDCHDCEHAKKQRNPYTKLSFLEKVKEMEAKIAQNDDVYNNALLVGNAFYNASYYGSLRAFYYNNILGEAGSLGVKDENRVLLLGMDKAKQYYLLAQKHATNDEQRAKIAYLIAKTERNEFYNQAYFYKNKDGANYDDVMFKDWKGFKELRKYPHTKYYKEVLNECEYFRKTVK